MNQIHDSGVELLSPASTFPNPKLGFNTICIRDCQVNQNTRKALACQAAIQ